MARPRLSAPGGLDADLHPLEALWHAALNAVLHEEPVSTASWGDRCASAYASGVVVVTRDPPDGEPSSSAHWLADWPERSRLRARARRVRTSGKVGVEKTRGK